MTTTTTAPTHTEAHKILTERLPVAWERTIDDPASYEQVRRELSALVHHDLSDIYFDNAMEAAGALYDLNMGGCLNLIYGDTNTPENREHWIAYETGELNDAINSLISGIRP